MADRMTAAEMLPLLQAWAKRHAELSKPLDELAVIFGGTFDGPLFDAVWLTWDAYTEQLAHRIGDTADWLQWYCSENDMGRKGLRVTWDAGAKGMNVRTLRHLAVVIAPTRTEVRHA